MLFVGGDAADGGVLSRALTADGWDVRGPAPAGTGAADKVDRPSLILVDARAGTAHSVAEIAATGFCNLEIATIPVIIWGDMRAEWPGPPVDERLSAAIAPDRIVAAVHPWQPGDLLAGARRLEAVFGAVEIGAMVAGFRRQLVEAVAAFDRSGDAGLAHRVAGIAGTLGFAAVGARWLALSEGDAAAWPDARRAARMAIAAIDRDLGRA